MEQENSVLLERWINYKNNEAERLNQQNAASAKDPKLSLQEQQAKTAQELANQGKAIMASKSKSSLLDAEAESGFVMVGKARRRNLFHLNWVCLCF